MFFVFCCVCAVCECAVCFVFVWSCVAVLNNVYCIAIYFFCWLCVLVCECGAVLLFCAVSCCCFLVCCVVVTRLCVICVFVNAF